MHTPAPWTTEPGQDRRVYLVNHNRAAVGEIVYTDTRNPADARLVAAAPDMLAALQFVLNDGNADLCAETAAIIQAAIDKATKTA
jgi:alkylation response protein AidB-like acyl-CoA dehydrogenase